MSEKKVEKINHSKSFNPPFAQSTLRKEIYDIVCESLKESTSHGIPHIIKREHLILKIMWIVFFVLLTSGCGFLIYRSMNDYFSYETVTKTEVVTEIPSVFPTVTICNLNLMMTNVSIDFASNFFIENKMLNNGSSFEQERPSFWFFDFLQYQYFAGITSYDSKKYSDSFRKSLGIKFEDMMLNCVFNLEPCTVDDFEWFYDPFYGNCYKFNSGKNASGHDVEDRISTKSGKINGLILELYVGEPTNITQFGVSTGAHVLVHNKSIKPMFYDGIDVPTGSMTNIAISREFISKLNYPHSECIEDVESVNSQLVETIIKSKKAYTQTNCYLLCYQKYLVNKCKCYDISILYWANDTRACLNTTDFDCIGKFYPYFFSQDVKSICSGECPLECESISYSLSLSSSDYPSMAYANYLKNNPIFLSKFPNTTNITYENLKRSILALSIFYDSLSYKHFIEMEKTDIVDLISNIGGQMGLFIGVSFLSFVEIIDIIIQILISVFTAATMKRRSKQILAKN